MNLKLFSSILLCMTTMSLCFGQDLSEVRKKKFEQLNSCDQAIYSNDQYLAVSMPSGATGIGHVRVESLVDDENFDLPAHGRIVDIKIENGNIYLLTDTTLEAWAIKDRTFLFSYATHPNVTPASSWRKKASGFILKDGKAVISHSVLGFTILDLKSGLVQKLLPMPTISSAQDIAMLNADTAIVGVDNDAEASFRGLYLMDLKSFEIVKQIKIDNAFVSSVRVLDNNRLMLGFFNAIWKFELNKTIVATKEPFPTRRAWKFPGLFMVDMKGKVFFDNKYLYACFNTMDADTNEREIKPLTIDLKEVKLN